MQHEVKKLPKSQIEITVTLSDEEFDKYRKMACEELSREVNIKGFRPGHVPADVIESHLGESVIRTHAEDVAIKMSYREVILKEKLPVVARPQAKVESQDPLKFVLTVAVMPEVEIKDYKDIKVKKEEVKVSDKDVNEAIDEMKKYGTTYKEVEEKAKKGDRVEVDFEGFDEKGEAVANTKSTNHPVILGSGSLIPGFEDELVGLKKDDKKEFDITFPKDYQKEDLRGKKLNFKVEIKMVEQATLPELTEEFIEKMSGKKLPVEEFKKELEKNIQLQKETQARKKHENDYLEKLLDKTKVEIPDSLIEEEARYILQDMQSEIQAKGVDFQRFLEHAKTTEEELLKKYHKEAEKRLKTRLAIQYVLKEEKIETTEEEILAEFSKIKGMYPPSEEKKIEDEFKIGELRNAIENRLTIQKFFDKVLG